MKKFKKADFDICEKFLAETKHMNDDEFVFTVTRMWIDVAEKPKVWNSIADVLTVSVDTRTNKRRK